MTGHIFQHVNDLISERDALKNELARTALRLAEKDEIIDNLKQESAESVDDLYDKLRELVAANSECARLQAEVDTLRGKLSSPARFLVAPRVVVQAATPEEAARVAKFLVGSHNLTVTLEVISADVVEENKLLRTELAEALARVKTLQTNLLGIAGLGAVYAGEE